MHWSNLRLDGVVRLGAVTDVLRTLEDAEGQGGEEVSGREEPGHGAQLETRLSWAQRRERLSQDVWQLVINHRWSLFCMNEYK